MRDTEGSAWETFCLWPLVKCKKWSSKTIFWSIISRQIYKIIKREHNSNLLKILSGVNILLQEARGRCPLFYAIKNLLTGYHMDKSSTG